MSPSAASAGKAQTRGISNATASRRTRWSDRRARVSKREEELIMASASYPRPHRFCRGAYRSAERTAMGGRVCAQGLGRRKAMPPRGMVSGGGPGLPLAREFVQAGQDLFEECLERLGLAGAELFEHRLVDVEAHGEGGVDQLSARFGHPQPDGPAVIGVGHPFDQSLFL